MKTPLLCVVALLLFQLQGMAQEFKLNYQLGYGNYAMKDLAAFQESILSTMVVEAKLLDNYPAYYNHQLQGAWVRENMLIGLSYLKMSTGSRISYKDYSGFLKLDSKLRADGVGVMVAKPLLDHKVLQLLLGGQGAVVLSRLTYDNQLQVNQQGQSEKMELVSTGILLEPMLRFSGKLAFLELGAEAACRLSLVNEGFHLKGKQDYKLVNSSGNDIKPDWTGLNIGVFFGITF